MNINDFNPPSIFKYEAMRIIEELDRNLKAYEIALEHANTDRMRELENEIYIYTLKLGKLMFGSFRDAEIL